jgi:hypothetical protein
MWEMLVCGVLGCVLGILQSLLTGVNARSWSGGTGLLWGLLIGILSVVAAAIVGWLGLLIAIGVPALIGLATFVDMARDRNRPP